LTFRFSIQGTLSPEVAQVIKCLKEAYGRKMERDTEPRDGASLKHRMAVFEKDFRDKIAVAIARGVGEPQWLTGRRDAKGERRRQRRGVQAGGCAMPIWTFARTRIDRIYIFFSFNATVLQS
jgi:hypothetical protein